MDPRKAKGLETENFFEAEFLKNNYKIIGRELSFENTKGRADFVLTKANGIYLVEIKSHKWVGTSFERIISAKQMKAYLIMGMDLKRKFPQADIYFWLLAKTSHAQVHSFLQKIL